MRIWVNVRIKFRLECWCSGYGPGHDGGRAGYRVEWLRRGQDPGRGRVSGRIRRYLSGEFLDKVKNEWTKLIVGSTVFWLSAAVF